MGLNAAVQALKKAEPLKNKVQRCKDLLTDNDAWICQQQLQKIYQQVLILDLEYALDKKVEQELWNLGFKNYISVLQTQAKDRKNPKRSESQAMLSWCLEAASGFYLSLLQEICTAFDLDLPFRRKGYIYGCIPPWKAIEKLSIPHKSSCFYACQYCLVHLGDIARYRNQNRQAELFYRHAVSLSPSSGQPYNQLALLEASRGDKLGTVFNYVRSVAVRHPFPVATSNLAKTLASTLTDNSFNINEKTKLDSQEYVVVFLKLHGILHNLGDFKLAKNYVKILSETLTALVATESFSSWRLIQMLIINFYSLHHIAGHVFESSMDLMKVDQLSSDEKTARSCILDLIAASLSALLLPVYTIKNSYVEYFALPSIKLCLDWIRQQPIILEDTAFSSRLQIWPSLCVFLNGLQSSISDFNAESYSKIPLPEDRDLQGFLPLEKTFESLRFCNSELEGDTASLNKLRAARIINLGQYLAQCQVNGASLLNVSGEKNQLKFTCMSDVSGPSNELMKELEELSLNKERQMIFTASPVPSESASSKGSSEAEITESSIFERRIGILKPEGPPGRGRDSLMSSTNNSDAQPHSNDINGVASTRKIRQNVAMQAIIKRAENEQKQVTFKNISPMIIEEIEVKKNPSIEVNHAMNNVMNPMSSAHNTQNPPLLQPSLVPRELASIHPKMIDKIDNPENQCFKNHEQNLQSPYESPDFINRSMNPQEPQFNENFGINRMQIPQIPMPQSLQSIQRLPPPLVQPSSSSISHPNMMINLPQGVLYQRPPNPEFFDRNYRQQSVLMGIAPINDYGKVHNVDENLQINRNGTNGMQVPYLKSVGQIGGNGLEFSKNLGQIPQNLSYPNRMTMNDCSSPQRQANYSMYRNYEADFNPWKDNQLPAPPVAWWGNIGKDKPEINAFQSWVNTSGTTPIQAPIISNNENYQKPVIGNSYVEENHCESDQIKGGNNTANTYSLFSGNSWGASVPSSSVTTQDQPKSRLTQQSLWSGPGPSPLERLLEQQKSLREGGT